VRRREEVIFSISNGTNSYLGTVEISYRFACVVPREIVNKEDRGEVVTRLLKMNRIRKRSSSSLDDDEGRRKILILKENNNRKE